MTPLENLATQFIKNDYTLLSIDDAPKTLQWQPSMVLSKDGFIYLILYKSNNIIFPAFLDRVSKIPKGNYIPLIIFSERLKLSEEEEILSLGVSIGYFIRSRIRDIQIKKRIANDVIKKEVKKKLTVIDIFVSSKQSTDEEIELPERKLVKDNIMFLRDADDYPFARPHLIEYDSFLLKDLYPHIDATINKCDWIIIILEDSHSEVVAYEIQKAITILDHENIFIFVKSTKICRKIWNKEIKKIEGLEDKSIKYLPYSDLTELRIVLTKAIHKRMNKIYELNGINRYTL